MSSKNKAIIYSVLGVPYVTALLYAITLGYQYVQLTLFKMPLFLIEFSPGKIAVAVALLGIYIFFAVITTHSLVSFTKLQLNNRSSVAKLVGVVVNIHFDLLASVMILLLEVPIIFKVLVVVPLLLTSAKRVWDLRNKGAVTHSKPTVRDHYDLIDLMRDRLNHIVTPIFGLFVVGLFGAIASTMVALTNKTYVQVEGYKNSIVVNTYDDKLVVTTYNPKTRLVTGEFYLVSPENDTKLKVNRYIDLARKP